MGGKGQRTTDLRSAAKSEAAIGGGFRRDIQGVRGVAVLLVLLFHAKIPGFSGGFFGVDIFYVISGYLITGLLIRERKGSGKISFKNFYARRARRLLPAATLVLLATLLASYLLAPRLLLSSIAFDVAAAALFLSNMNFAHHATDYFASSLPSPVLHYWSLSVEEQYYAIAPALVALVTLKAKRVSLRLFFVLLTIGSGSFYFAIWLLHRNQSWAFFSLPSRAWELALGGLLAAMVGVVDRLKAWVLWAASWCGAGLLLFSVLSLRESDPFPGWPALLPTVGSALLLLGGSRGWGSKSARGAVIGSLPNRALTIWPLSFFGKISYSLYLWHWPVLIIAGYRARGGLSLNVRWLLVLLSVLLATTTYYLIEDPLRRGRVIGKRPVRNLALAVVLVLVTTSAGVVVNQVMDRDAARAVVAAKKLSLVKSSEASKAAKVRLAAEKAAVGAVRPATLDFPVPADLSPSLIAAGNDRPLSYTDRCHTQQNLTPSIKACMYGDPNGSKTIVLFGDSHALAWFPAVNQMAKQEHYKLLSLTMSACVPADIPAYDRVSGKVMVNCTLWRKESLAKIVAVKPYLVLLTGTRGFVTVDSKGAVVGGLAGTSLWEAGMARTIAKLKSAATHVIMISDVPQSIYDPKVCLSQSPGSTLVCASPLNKAISLPWLAIEAATATANKVKVIDPTLWVCPSNPCPVVIGKVLVYLDAGHLTATFAADLTPELSGAVAAALKP